ncbi:MAG: hypothetical protein QMD12_02730 [Candidatus Aenigmarchaeota archaeon]|nr:hypothetical protein [Candidatus Aenigmarchaeota archaeon]
MRKGILTIAIGGAIVIVGTIVMLVLPFFVLKIHLIQNIKYRYEYDNSQLYLLTLLSKTHDGKLIYTQIANNLQTGEPDISFVKDELEKIVGNRCYNLSTTKKIIAQSACKPSKYTVKTKLVLPYPSLVDTLTLVID